MSDLAEMTLKQALALPAIERAAMIEKLISSLDRPDAAVDALWTTEATRRLAAYRAGEIEALDADEVFSAFERRP